MAGTVELLVCHEGGHVLEGDVARLAILRPELGAGFQNVRVDIHYWTVFNVNDFFLDIRGLDVFTFDDFICFYNVHFWFVDFLFDDDVGSRFIFEDRFSDVGFVSIKNQGFFSLSNERQARTLGSGTAVHQPRVAHYVALVGGAVIAGVAVVQAVRARGGRGRSRWGREHLPRGHTGATHAAGLGSSSGAVVFEDARDEVFFL